MDNENKKVDEQEKYPEWMRSVVFGDLSEIYDRIAQENACRGISLAAAIKELYLRYEVTIRKIVNSDEIDADSNMEAGKLVIRVCYLKELCKIVQDGYGFFTQDVILRELKSARRDALPLWVPGTLFEEIDTAYSENKSVPVLEWKFPGKGWALIDEFDRLQNAVNYVSDCYVKYIESPRASQFRFGELKLRSRLSRLTFIYLLQESLVEYPNIIELNWSNNAVYIKQG